MENSIEYLCKEIYLNIPLEILNEAFKPNEQSLDAIIKENIIVDIVLRRCNLYSGKLAKIPLKSSYLVKLESSNNSFLANNTYVYKIPLEDREYRDISHVIALSYPIDYLSSISYSYSMVNEQKSICSMKDRILGSNVNYDNIPIIPVPILMKNNMIRLEPNFETNIQFILSCLLKYDSNFTNISPNSLRYLSQLCILATKSFIYNKLIIPLGSAYLVGGQELGRFKEIVESYENANEEFEDKLKKFRAAEVFDKDMMLGMISLMI